MISKTSCIECRHGTLKHKKVKSGINKTTGKAKYKMIPRYHCGYYKTTHAIDQESCEDYVGHQTVFEYLMATQPDEVNKLLSSMDLRVVGSNNKWGFDIK